ncbi:ZFY27 protein, partial [Amia calva]|nr:ZFY27 protein [Amia calva]
MVISYKRMGIFLEPLTDTWELMKYILRWKMPVCSLLCCILLNILFLTLSEVAWFSLCLLGISTPAALGYLQDCSQDKAPEPALQRKRHHAVQKRDLQTVHLSRQEAMLEVKGLLVQLDEILSQACQSAESMYRVLYWEDHSASFLFYGGLLTGLCLVYIAPLCWVLAAVNSALFLWNREFCRVVLELKEFFHQGRLKPTEEEAENLEPEQQGFVDRTPTPTSVEDFSPGSVEEAEEAEPDDEFKDAIEEEDEVPVGAADFDLVSDNGLLSRNEPIRSKVSKLTEKLRKRYPTNNCGMYGVKTFHTTSSSLLFMLPFDPCIPVTPYLLILPPSCYLKCFISNQVSLSSSTFTLSSRSHCPSYKPMVAVGFIAF